MEWRSRSNELLTLRPVDYEDGGVHGPQHRSSAPPYRDYDFGCRVVRCIVEPVRIARKAFVASVWLCGCAASDGGSDPGATATEPTNTEDTHASESDSSTATTSDGSTTVGETGGPGGDAAAEGTTGGLPEGPACSVQVVTHAALLDPVAKGEEPGLIPTVVGDALEDYCGCHTLESTQQNVELPFARPPSGSLFLRYEDFARPYKSTTLGEASASEVRGYRMPTGSCPFPDSAADLLVKWFDDGMPDGATFEPR